MEQYPPQFMAGLCTLQLVVVVNGLHREDKGGGEVVWQSTHRAFVLTPLCACNFSHKGCSSNEPLSGTIVTPLATSLGCKYSANWVQWVQRDTLQATPLQGLFEAHVSWAKVAQLKKNKNGFSW